MHSPWDKVRTLRQAWLKLMVVLPHERGKGIMKLTNHTALIEAGIETRFGPEWPGRRCGAKTRSGGACQNPAIKGRDRCKLHGGLSTGPRTPEGKARAAAAHTKHGRRSAAHVEKVKFINGELRRITYELKRDGLIP